MMNELIEKNLQYSNWMKATIDLMKPKNLYLVAGRGTAKSTDILAERSIDVVNDMPQATFAFVADTYVNLMCNVIPAVLEGWERKDFIQGRDYVVDDAPPLSWPTSFTKTFEFKRRISTSNGCAFVLKSLDRPSANAGISVQHIFGDEAKYFKEAKLKKALPVVRGNAQLFGNSKYFMGHTFCTDMPSFADNESDWILKMADRMDKKYVITCLQAGIVINELKLELVDELMKGNSFRVERIQRQIQRWEDRILPIRKQTSFFYMVSSLANIDILTLDYFKDLIASLERDDLLTSVLSIKDIRNPGKDFYYNLTDKNTFKDSYNYDIVDRFGIRDVGTINSTYLKHVNPTDEIEAGLDAGNMMSLTCAQMKENRKLLKIFKCFHTLPPEHIPELAANFLEFFKSHRKKRLILFYDRSANQYSKTGRDIATQFINAIMYKDSKPTGWFVEAKSRDQRTIYQSQEYDFANHVLKGTDSRFPRVEICAYECSNLVSSMKLAKATKDSRGRIQKVKTSEKLAFRLLPSNSTNYPDSFKYLICRDEWLMEYYKRK